MGFTNANAVLICSGNSLVRENIPFDSEILRINAYLIGFKNYYFEFDRNDEIGLWLIVNNELAKRMIQFEISSTMYFE